jgi:membrane protein
VTEPQTIARRAWQLAVVTGRSAWYGLAGFYDSDDLTHAASIAYYSLLSLFPFLLLAFTLLGYATSEAANRNAVLSFVLQYFPAQFGFITEQLDSFRGSHLTMGVAGTLALVWGAVGVFGATSAAINHAWGVEDPRGFWQHKLFSFVMFGVAALMLLAALFLVSASQMVGARWFADILMSFPGLAILSSFAVRNATTLLFILVVGGMFYFVPSAKVRLRDVWAGAIVTGLLWKGAFVAFTWYMQDMTRLTLVDGSIAVVVAFLVWVYLQAIILLYGAEFTAAYVRLQRGEAPTPARATARGQSPR